MNDVPIEHAMLCFTSTSGGDKPAAKVIEHPDERGLSDSYSSSVGACFAYWHQLDEQGRKLQLMVEAWHAAAFYGVPVELLHEAMLVIPEYRSMLADDCLSKQFRHERE